MNSLTTKLLFLAYIFWVNAAVPTTLHRSHTGNITGVYKNNNGARLTLECVGTAGAASLQGWYVSESGKAAGTYPVSGRSTSCDNDAQLSFSVAWSNQQNGNSFSATSWAARASGSNPINLYAVWVMVSETAPDDDWQSTNIGVDFFYKTDTSSTSTIS